MLNNESWLAHSDLFKKYWVVEIKPWVRSLGWFTDYMETVKDADKPFGLLLVFTLNLKEKNGTIVSTVRLKFPYGQTARIGLSLSRSIHY